LEYWVEEKFLSLFLMIPSFHHSIIPKFHFSFFGFMSYVLYGIHPVREALKSSRLRFEKVLIGAQTPSPLLQSIIDQALLKRIPVATVGKETMDRLAEGGVHQDVAGILKEAPSPYSDLAQLLAARSMEERALFLILDGIQDPQNLGSLIRTALGTGVQGLILPRDRAAGITPVVMKASAGAAVHLPVARVVNIASTIDSLKGEGIWVYGAAGEAGEPIYDLDLKTDVAIVIGSEGKGIRPLVKKRCDRLFSIPMKGPVTSFNASVSGGMILYEVMRQRHSAAVRDRRS
jgi:23S rRNA (guanosine2251-2'-O)-methyltransferase